jgi:hypothetical protein
MPRKLRPRCPSALSVLLSVFHRKRGDEAGRTSRGGARPLGFTVGVCVLVSVSGRDARRVASAAVTPLKVSQRRPLNTIDSFDPEV